MPENGYSLNLESLIQKFQQECESPSEDFKIHELEYFLTDEVKQTHLYSLAKQILERLSPNVLASQDDHFHTLGDQLITIFKNAYDTGALLKIAKMYEKLEDYHWAEKAYSSSRDWESIVGFVSRSIHNRKSIKYAVSILKELKEFEKLKKEHPFLADMIFYKAFGYRDYGLAMDIAHLLIDKWKIKEVDDATKVPLSPTSVRLNRYS